MNAIVRLASDPLALQVARGLAQLVLVIVFAVAGIAKLARIDKTRTMLGAFGVPVRLIAPASLLLPLGELATAAGLLVPIFAWPASAAAALMLALFTAAVGIKLAQGLAPDCNCFGQTKSAPIGPRTLARNGLLLVLAIALVGFQPAFASPASWGAVPTMLAWFAVAGIFGAVFTAMLAISIVRLQRWLRHRRFQYERAQVLGTLKHVAPITLKPASSGLPVGSPAPDFHLSDGNGNLVGLADLLDGDRPVLLTFVSAGCPSCEALAGDAQGGALGAAARLVLVREGPVDRQRRGSGTLFQIHREVADSYRSWGSPEAVLVMPDATIGSSVLKGLPAIRSALAARPRVLPPAPPGRIGAPVPPMSFRDQHGRARSLADFRGRELLMLFWSPYCSYCQNMLDTLASWAHDPPPWAPALLVIAPAAKDNEPVLKLGAPLAIDVGRKFSTVFGVNGTPTGVLLDDQGRIAAEAAIGADAIMALANGVMTAHEAARSWQSGRPLAQPVP